MKMKNLCDYYHIRRVDFNYLLRELEDYGSPIRFILACKVMIVLLNYVIDYAERIDTYDF